MALLEVTDLSVSFKVKGTDLQVVDQISFELQAGQSLGIVGESGSGKSVTALALMRLLPQPSGSITSGKTLLSNGPDREMTDITKLPADDLLKIRGRRIAMIFQEPMTALNPVHRIGNQLIEAILLHFPKNSKKQAWNKSIELLKEVGIPAPEQRMKEYPHQLSGGMRQRVVIAIALSCEPDILIADEPTTALDVTVQMQILSLINTLKETRNMGVILITHDLGVVTENCDDVLVMYAGRMAEKCPADKLFHESRHPYTKALMRSIPGFSVQRKSKLNTIPGQVPALQHMPSGCRFAKRSNYKHKQQDLKERPTWLQITPEHGIENCPSCQTALNAEDKTHA